MAVQMDKFTQFGPPPQSISFSQTHILDPSHSRSVTFSIYHVLHSSRSPFVTFSSAKFHLAALIPNLVDKPTLINAFQVKQAGVLRHYPQDAANAFSTPPFTGFLPFINDKANFIGEFPIPKDCRIAVLPTLHLDGSMHQPRQRFSLVSKTCSFGYKPV